MRCLAQTNSLLELTTQINSFAWKHNLGDSVMTTMISHHLILVSKIVSLKTNNTRQSNLIHGRGGWTLHHLTEQAKFHDDQRNVLFILKRTP